MKLIFPDTITHPKHWKAKEAIAAFILIILTGLVLILRRPDAFSSPQFFADDGYGYFKLAYLHGWSSLFEMHSGYFNLLPRAMACLFISLADLSIQPLLYSLSAYTICIFLSVYLFHRLKNHCSFVQRFALAGSISMIPVGNEVFMNLCEMQFFLCPLLLIPFLWPSNELRIKIIDGIAMITTALSSPFVVIFFPVLLGFWSIHKSNRKNRVLIALYIVCAIIQISAIASQPNNRTNEHFVWTESAASAANLIYLTVAYPFHIHWITNSGIWWIKYPAFSIIILLIGILLFLSAKAFFKATNPLPITFLLASIVLFGATVWAYRSQVAVLHPAHSGTRYFYTITLLAFWAVILLLNQKVIVPSMALLAGFVFFRFSTMYPPTAYPENAWKQYAPKLQQGSRPLNIPIAPNGFYLRFAEGEFPK